MLFPIFHGGADAASSGSDTFRSPVKVRVSAAGLVLPACRHTRIPRRHETFPVHTSHYTITSDTLAKLCLHICCPLVLPNRMRPQCGIRVHGDGRDGHKRFTATHPSEKVGWGVRKQRRVYRTRSLVKAPIGASKSSLGRETRTRLLKSCRSGCASQRVQR